MHAEDLLSRKAEVLNKYWKKKEKKTKHKEHKKVPK